MPLLRDLDTMCSCRLAFFGHTSESPNSSYRHRDWHRCPTITPNPAGHSSERHAIGRGGCQKLLNARIGSVAPVTLNTAEMRSATRICGYNKQSGADHFLEVAPHELWKIVSGFDNVWFHLALGESDAHMELQFSLLICCKNRFHPPWWCFNIYTHTHLQSLLSSPSYQTIIEGDHSIWEGLL